MAPHRPHEHDEWLIRLMLKSSPTDISEEEIAYFRENPHVIDEISAPLHIHRFFLWVGTLLGVSLVAASKFLVYGGLPIALGEGVREFVVDIVFEIGVALIGAAVTAYLLGVLLNRQQDQAAMWRAEIRRRIGQSEGDEPADR